MRFVVIQFSAYLTEFRKALLSTRYGVALRNLIYVKPDKKLYFLDNVQGEHCLSHPEWSNVSDVPATFPPDTHTHDWSDVTGEPATYPPENHMQDLAHGGTGSDLSLTGPGMLIQYTSEAPVTVTPSIPTNWFTGIMPLYNGGTGSDLSASGPGYLKQTVLGELVETGPILVEDLPEHTHPRIVGEMMIWPTDSPPAGWLLCYGQAISRSTYAVLFALLGTTYGTGNGSTTFNLPDLRGRFPLGQDDMGGSSANRVTATEADNLGQASGAETHTLSSGEMPSHTHTQNAHTHTQNSHNHTQDAHTHSMPYQSAGSNGTAAWKSQSTIQGNTNIDSGVVATNQAATATNQNATATNQNTGGGGTHNNMPPYLTLNFAIYAGV